jgi:hypothetical protein
MRKSPIVSRRRLLQPMIIGGLLIIGPAACGDHELVDPGSEVETGGLNRSSNGKGASGPSYTPSSPSSTTVVPSSSDPDAPPAPSRPDPRNCSYTQGFWKNHAKAWPVAALTLGQRTYTKAELLAIFARPVNGNGLVSLGHQLIAARLNLALGAAPDGLAGVLAEADALIGALVIPPVGDGSLPTAMTSSANDALAAFNEGRVGPGHCDDAPKPTSPPPTTMPPPPTPPPSNNPPSVVID